MNPSSRAHLRRLIGAVLTTGALLGAQTPSSAEYEARLNEQENRLRALEESFGNGANSLQNAAGPGYYVGYDGGFVIRSLDMKKDPFELKINGRMQFRYSGFAEEKNSFSNMGTRAAGPNPARTQSRSDFEIERGRLMFSGTFLYPELHFFINLDADTDDNHQVIFHDFWINYDVCENASVYIGKAFVPGSREWLGGSTRTHFADRSVATTFFRPDRSVGIWVIGEAAEGMHYRAMVANGYNTTDLNRNAVNRDLVYSATIWFEPNGKFGKGYADLKSKPEVRTRFGASFTYSEQSGVAANGRAVGESNFLRLDDGTRLTSLGVNKFDQSVLAVDAAIKVAGFSLHGEGYFRWLERIGPNGALPTMAPFTRNEAYGGYLASGYMIVPEKFEVVLMSSTVQGDFKDTWEYGCAFNWYVDGNHKNKLTVDAININGTPVSNSGLNYRVGDDGTMVRIQHQIAF